MLFWFLDCQSASTIMELRRYSAVLVITWCRRYLQKIFPGFIKQMFLVPPSSQDKTRLLYRLFGNKKLLSETPWNMLAKLVLLLSFPIHFYEVENGCIHPLLPKGFEAELPNSYCKSEDFGSTPLKCCWGIQSLHNFELISMLLFAVA